MQTEIDFKKKIRTKFPEVNEVELTVLNNILLYNIHRADKIDLDNFKSYTDFIAELSTRNMLNIEPTLKEYLPYTIWVTANTCIDSVINEDECYLYMHEVVPVNNIDIKVDLEYIRKLAKQDNIDKRILRGIVKFKVLSLCNTATDMRDVCDADGLTLFIKTICEELHVTRVQSNERLIHGIRNFGYGRATYAYISKTMYDEEKFYRITGSSREDLHIVMLKNYCGVICHLETDCMVINYGEDSSTAITYATELNIFNELEMEYIVGFITYLLDLNVNEYDELIKELKGVLKL